MRHRGEEPGAGAIQLQLASTPSSRFFLVLQRKDSSESSLPVVSDTLNDENGPNSIPSHRCGRRLG